MVSQSGESTCVNAVKSYDDRGALRKYSTSIYVVAIFVCYMAFVGIHSFEKLNLFACVVIAVTTFFIFLYPIRVRSHFYNNEFLVSELAMVVAIYWLDTFQASLAVMLGASCAYIKASNGIEGRRHLIANAYNVFVVLSLTGIVLGGDFDSSHWYFPIEVILIGCIFAAIDVVMMVAMCRFRIRELLSLFLTPIRLVTIGICFVLGAPAIIIVENYPIYSIVVLGSFVGLCFFLSKYHEAVALQEQQQVIIDVLIDGEKQSENVDVNELIVSIAKTVLRHDMVEIRSAAPDSDTEVGELLYCDDQGEKWLVFRRSAMVGKFSTRDGKILKDIAMVARKTIEYRAMREQILNAAQRDALTGAVNRRTLEEVVNKELGSCGTTQQVSLLFIDIDGFKPVNDTYGHEVGDEVLRMITQRLDAVVREGDVVSRVGGDEFVVMCSGLTPNSAEQMSQRIVDALCVPYQIDMSPGIPLPHDDIVVGASVGISNSPNDGTSCEELLRAADHRMYGSKRKNTSSRIVRAKRTADARLRVVDI